MKNILLLTLFLFSTHYLSAQCIDDGHSPFQDHGWMSCNTSVGPIPERGDVHWIMYDLGDTYAIDSLYIWNHNVWGETGFGAKTILIDYSTDQNNWTTAGPFEISQALGSWQYTGTEGPTLGNADMRYVHVTVIDNWSDDLSCVGLGEVRFSIGESVSTDDVISEEVLWSISPNPAQESILIQLPDDIEVRNIALYNSLGHNIKSLTLPVGNQLFVMIDDLIEGVYYVSYQSDNDIQTKSFVKVN